MLSTTSQLQRQSDSSDDDDDSEYSSRQNLAKDRQSKVTKRYTQPSATRPPLPSKPENKTRARSYSSDSERDEATVSERNGSPSTQESQCQEDDDDDDAKLLASINNSPLDTKLLKTEISRKSTDNAATSNIEITKPNSSAEGWSPSYTPIIPPPDLTDIREFLISPVSKACGVVQCYIKRNKSGVNKLYPVYSLYLKVHNYHSLKKETYRNQYKIYIIVNIIVNVTVTG